MKPVWPITNAMRESVVGRLMEIIKSKQNDENSVRAAEVFVQICDFWEFDWDEFTQDEDDFDSEEDDEWGL